MLCAAQNMPLYSADGSAFLMLEPTGALVLRSSNSSSPVWSSGTPNTTSHAPYALAMQEVLADAPLP